MRRVAVALVSAAIVAAVAVGLAIALPRQDPTAWIPPPTSATPSPTPALNVHTWLAPIFPWRTGVAIMAAMAVMGVIAAVVRHRARRDGASG